MLKNTGIIRKVDELGRIGIPIEIRNQFCIMEKGLVEIFIENNNIILKKYQPNCILCRNNKDLLSYNGKLICSKCITKISNMNIQGGENGKIVL